jgi:uncharacterized membrane protein
MPFCSHCGNQVTSADIYCARCGTTQPYEAAARPAPPHNDPLAGVSSRTASILCYIPAVGWIISIIVLASLRFRTDRTVRFHAFQGIYLFVATLVADFVFRPLFWMVPNLHLYQFVQLALLGMSIFMMVKASHDEAYALPLFGELAHRSIAEH